MVLWIPLCIVSMLVIGRMGTASAESSRSPQNPTGSADRAMVDFRILSGAEAVIPISVELGQIIVNTTINGHGPFPMMLDTGARNTLTTATIARLGIKTEGTGSLLDSGGRNVSLAYTKLDSVHLGDAEMTNQRFAVVDLPKHLMDRGSRPPIAGLLGYEFLERFAARVDYEGATLRLRSGSPFHYDGAGTGVPLTLAGNTPEVPGTADGIAGLFIIDTGSVGALTLRRGFVRDHGFDVRHPSALRVKSIGAAGPFEAIMTRLDRLEIADSRIDRPATRYAATDTEGFPFTDVDGSIGYEILRQFVITFDYQHDKLWFERSSTFGARTGQGSAGFQAVKVESGGFRVTTVLPKTAAAAAGMEVGDIISDIDGHSTLPLSLSEFAVLIRRPVGTLVRLGTVRSGIPRPIVLKLDDILP